jgi:hypothetical protein
MAILNNNPLVGASGNQGGYNINNSLRLRSSASAYLSRTPASAGSQTTWTWSGWVKLGALTGDKGLFERFVSGSEFHTLAFRNSNEILFYSLVNPTDYGFATTAKFRDPSAWYHVVATFDTTNATAADRMRLYINGIRQTAFAVDYASPPQNYVGGWNGATLQSIGRFQDTSSFADNYLAEINFIDGQALTPSSFGETDTTTGVWKPKAYTGTYGTNGFYLKFSDIATTSGSNAGLGKDFSGNSNYWTTNNISVTSGTTYDAMTDSPTLTSATVANYCVLSPLAGDAAPTSGNLYFSGTDKSTLGTVGVTSSKWYFEMTCVSNVATTNLDGVGIGNCGINNSAPDKAFYIYRSNGNKLQNGGSNTSYGSSFTTGDVIGVAYDADAGTLVFYKNNVSQGTAFTGITGTMLPIVYARGITSTPTLALNFGQQPFIYTPPTGYNRLNTYNLPDSTIKKGNSYMDATLYTGNGSTQTITNANGFRPDLVWQKPRSEVASHRLVDSVRGVNNVLYSNQTAVAATETNTLTAFNSNGFTGGGSNAVTSGNTAVAWQWQAGQGTTSSNTSGSITSTVSVNATAGFSIVTYTANSNSTVGHGLGVAPKVVIMKSRTVDAGWLFGSDVIGWTNFLWLNLTNASTANSTVWNNTAPTSSVFTLGSGVSTANYGDMVAYCWAEIAGFSRFGSYTGNGSTDGPFVYTGFRPKFVLIKYSSGAENWAIWDTSRNTYNVMDTILRPDSTAADTSGSTQNIDFVSNGFKIRGTDGKLNTSSGTYIYMAFAENPFKNSLAR